MTTADFITWACFFIFLTLKLTHFIDWSWWWITAPIWGQIVLGAVLGIIIGLFGKTKTDYGKLTIVQTECADAKKQ